QGEGERDWDREQHYAGFPPAQRQSDQQSYRQRRDQQMLQQFIGLILRGLAIVARDRDAQIIGQDISAQRVDSLQYIFRNSGRIRAFALGQRDGDGGIIRA